MKKKLLTLLLVIFVWGCGAQDSINSLQKEFDHANEANFISAIIKSDIITISNYIEKGGDINFSSKNNTTPLYISMVLENKQTFDLLLKNGADFNIKRVGRSGMSSFLLAANNESDSYFLEQILKNGANPNILNIDNPTMPTPVFYAAESFNLKNMGLLPKHRALLDWQNQYNETPLIYAANLNQFDMVYKLLELGADYKLKDKWGKSIVYSLKNNNVDPNSDLFIWRKKSIDFLKNKGVIFQ